MRNSGLLAALDVVPVLVPLAAVVCPPCTCGYVLGLSKRSFPVA